MNFFKTYRTVFLLMILFWVIFVSLFYLYHLPVVAAAYPLVLCSLITLGVLLYDYKKRKEKLRELANTLKVEDPKLPKVHDDIEAAYGMLVEELKKRLKNLNKHAKERNKSSEDTIALWIHQIKTPITSLKLILDTGEAPPGARAQLFRIEQYVEMILNYFRLESDKTDYVFKRVDLEALVRESVKKFSSEFILRRNRLELGEIGLYPVSDEKWLSFVLEQILSNSLKYTDGGTITIACEKNRLVIKDTGIGIKHSDLPRIFERGYTGYNGRDQKNASGLGLYLSKRVLDELGIEIGVESCPEAGTTVTLYF